MLIGSPNSRVIFQRFFLIAVILIYVSLRVFFSNNGFFWDSVAGVSIPATFLYEHGLFNFAYPSTFVAEPPLVHFFVAASWKLFGRTLLVTHMGMMLIGLGVIFQLHRLLKRYASTMFYYLFFMVLVVESVLLTQLLITSSDIFLFFFFLLGVNSILDRKRCWLMLAVFLLAITSMRAFAMSAGLGLWYVFMNGMAMPGRHHLSILWYSFLPFIPAVVGMLGFLIFRKITLGVFLLHPDSAWVDDRQWAGFAGLVKNLLTLGWFSVEGGKFYWWLLLFYSLWRFGWREVIKSIPISLSALFLTVSAAMLLITLPLSNNFGPRYFAMHFILFELIVLLMVRRLWKKEVAAVLMVVGAVLMLASNLVPYPERKARAWDSTLAQLPYYELRDRVIKHFDIFNIPLEKVGFGFPNTAPLDAVDLSGDTSRFSEIDTLTNHYVVYTNIGNRPDWEIDYFSRQKPYCIFESGGVFMRIYKIKEEKKRVLDEEEEFFRMLMMPNDIPFF